MASDFIYVHMGILTVSYFDWNNTPIYTRMYKKKYPKAIGILSSLKCNYVKVITNFSFIDTDKSAI